MFIPKTQLGVINDTRFMNTQNRLSCAVALNLLNPYTEFVQPSEQRQPPEVCMIYVGLVPDLPSFRGINVFLSLNKKNRVRVLLPLFGKVEKGVNICPEAPHQPCRIFHDNGQQRPNFLQLGKGTGRHCCSRCVSVSGVVTTT